MGTWGTGMFQDDMAGDVKDAFEAGLAELRTPATISRAILKDYEDWHTEDGIDEDELNFYILVLAAVELKYDAVQPDIKERALQILANGGDLESWEGNAHPETVEERRVVLENLRNELLSFNPEQAKQKLFTECDQKLKVGDIMAIEMIPNRFRLGIVLHTPNWHERVVLVSSNAFSL